MFFVAKEGVENVHNKTDVIFFMVENILVKWNGLELECGKTE